MGFPKGVKRDYDALENRRLQAAELFDKGQTQAEVRRKLKISPQSASRWYASWKAGGKSSLRKAGRAGRLPRLTAEQKDQVKAALLEGPEAHGYATALWTVGRVTALIAEITGVKYHKGHAWKILRGLGWSSQRPVGRALERNEQAIAAWKKKQWPAIKKKRLQKAER
jgi:transposase